MCNKKLPVQVVGDSMDQCNSATSIANSLLHEIDTGRNRFRFLSLFFLLKVTFKLQKENTIIIVYTFSMTITGDKLPYC